MGLWGRGVAPGRPWKLSSVKDFIPPPHIPAPKEQQPFRGGSLRHCSAQLAALGESAVESWASGQSRPREGEKWSSTLTAHCATGSGGNSLFTINSFIKSLLLLPSSQSLCFLPQGQPVIPVSCLSFKGSCTYLCANPLHMYSYFAWLDSTVYTVLHLVLQLVCLGDYSVSAQSKLFLF